jgi:hypothetical protein
MPGSVGGRVGACWYGNGRESGSGGSVKLQLPVSSSRRKIPGKVSFKSGVVLAERPLFGGIVFHAKPKYGGQNASLSV